MQDKAAGEKRNMSLPPRGVPTSGSESASGQNSTGVYPLSSWRVRRFVPALRRISSELNLPEPTKSRLLLEMASDLEALYEHYRARGVDEEEAVRRTEEKILASPEVLQHLIAVHTRGYQRWLSHAAGRMRLGFELLLFTLGVLPMLAIAALTVIARVNGISPPLLLWTLFLIGVAIATLTLWKRTNCWFGGCARPPTCTAGCSLSCSWVQSVRFSPASLSW